MNKKKKIIYSVIIASCVLLGWVVIVVNKNSVPQVNFTQPLSSKFVPPATQNPAVSNVYSVPTVFPADPKYDLSIFDSSVFKTLKIYDTLQVSKDDLGKENPFAD